MVPEPSSDELALIARLARGIEHRLNNVTTVLMISSQQVAELEGVADDDRNELVDLLNRSAASLTLLQDVLIDSSMPVDPKRAVRAVAAVTSGMHHRVVVQADPGAGELGATRAASTPILRSMIALALVAHTALPRGGEVALVATKGPAIWVKFRGAGALTHAALAQTAAADLELASNAAARAGAALEPREWDDWRGFTIVLPSPAPAPSGSPAW